MEQAHAEIASRGFTVYSMGAEASVKDMERAALELMRTDPERLGSYNGTGMVERQGIDKSLFTDVAAGAPAELTIQFHHEMAYAAEFPNYVTFAMVQQAAEGGTTTLADSIAVQQKFPPALLKKFRTLGVQYIRILHDESEKNAPDFCNSWQGVFQTSSLEEAMQKGNNPANFSVMKKLDDRRLKQSWWCPVFQNHPVHGELFVSSLLNMYHSWLDRHPNYGPLPTKDRPYQCTWGDGAEFSMDEISQIRKAHEESTEFVRLDPGDVCVVDNLRVAHGRTPFKGSRLLGLLLSDMRPRDPCEAPNEFAKIIA
ncbi:unnamed protein product [Effrenium voratum]|nr:unnamed protein product [Effrenium voratum]